MSVGRDFVPQDAKARILLELLGEFVEDRVRQRPTSAFNLLDVMQAIGAVLRDAGSDVALDPSNDMRIVDWLNQHPFLLRPTDESTNRWKPGLNKHALRRV
jgi:hypothetical protein